MCAIIDVNVVHELWDRGGTEAGQEFRLAVERGRVPLVVGGSALEDELSGAGERLRRWLQELRLSGRLTQHPENDKVVDETASQLRSLPRGSGTCRSNDHHIVALAIVSGARLLYTNDRALTGDFKDKRLIDNPRGKVYSTTGTTSYDQGKKRLLNNRELCKTIEATS